MKKIKYSAALTAVLASLTTVAQAEILVILPETGPMASAAASLKRGLIASYETYPSKTEKLRFVDENKFKIDDILKNKIRKDTRLVVGPLSRQNVARAINLRPKIKMLTLNAVNGNHPTIMQFALSPDQDALALTKQIQADHVNELLVVRDPAFAAETKGLSDALTRLWGSKMQTVSQVPTALNRRQGLLMLGSNQWLNSFAKLPIENIYAHAVSIEQNKKTPRGVTFCDTPGLYGTTWPDLTKAYNAKPVSLPYQRLMAFGGDAWQMANLLTSNYDPHQVIQFKGRTGDIRVIKNQISRAPQCFKAVGNGYRYL